MATPVSLLPPAVLPVLGSDYLIVDQANAQATTGYVTRRATVSSVVTGIKPYVSILDFGADPTGATPCDTALANARTYIASNKAVLVFPAGTYTYSTSPNWGITNAEITTGGLVTLNYTGTGYAVNIDAGASSGLVYGMSFAGNFIVKSNVAAKDAVFVRSIHHSTISLRVSACGPTYAGLRVNFSVCTEYNIVVSVNEGLVAGAIPLYGLYLDCRGASEQTSACIFTNPIVEGVGSVGIYLQSAAQNTFNGGTSEANTGGGVYVSANSTFNTFNKLDMEVNGVGYNDILDNGLSTAFNGCLSGGRPTTKVTFAGTNAIVSGGTYNNIYNTGTGTNFNNVTYANNGGVFSNTGTYTSSTRMYNNTIGTYDTDLNAFSIGPVVKAGVASGVATTMFALPTTGGTRFYQVLAYLPLTGDTTNYAAYALIAQDTTSSRIITQVDGARLTITLSGGNVQVTQTSGANQDYVTAIANPI